MASKALAIIGLTFLFGLQSWAAGRAPQEIVVTVVNKQYTPARPVPDVRVALTYFDGSGKITDARRQTNRQGQTELSVWPEAQESGDLRIEVSGAEGLAVFEPREGLVNAIKPNLTIVLLPKGSPAWLEPAQLEAMLNRLSRLNLQNQRLTTSLAKMESQKLDFFDLSLHDWADSKGLAYNEVDKKIRAWADQVLADKDNASLTKQAEAELGLRHYEKAALLFQNVTKRNIQALDEEEANYLEGRRKKLRDTILSATQAATSFQLSKQFHEATDILDQALKKAAAEHQHFPDDAALKDVWLSTRLLSELVRFLEAKADLTADVQLSISLLVSIAEDAKLLQAQLDKSRDPDKWAYTQVILSGTYLLLSELSSTQEAAGMRMQAVDAIRALQTGYSRERDPRTWASFQVFAGLVFGVQAARNTTDARGTPAEAAALLEDSAAAFRAALGVYTEAENPMDWASAQEQLAGILSTQGFFATGKRATDLMAQALATNRQVVKFFNKNEHPKEWARAMQSQGMTLQGYSLLLSHQHGADSNQQSKELLAEAVSSFRLALEVFTQQNDPEKWANTQSTLAHALKDLAGLTNGNEANELLTQSVEAYRAEQKVFTKTAFPQRWARTQTNLGDALAQQGELPGSPKSSELLDEAVTAYSAALEIFTREEYPQRWAQAQAGLADTLANRGFRVAPAQSIDLFQKAIVAYRFALDVFNKTSNPHDWSNLESHLGTVLGALAARVPADQSTPLFTQAAEAFSAALEVDSKNAGILSELSSIYHEYVIDFPKAYEFAARAAAEKPSVENQMNLAEAALTSARFPECINVLSPLKEPAVPDRLAPARLTILLACQWGTGQKQATTQTAESFQPFSAAMPQGGWRVTGDLKYLAAAPEFKTGRPLWLKLFQSLQDNNGPSLAEAARGLHQLIGQ